MLSYESAAATCKHLKQKGWHDSFLSFMDACTLWDDNRLDNPTALDIIHKWAPSLCKFDTTDEFGLIAFLEGIRFMLPTVPVPPRLEGVKVRLSGRQVNMLFTKDADGAKVHMLSWIHAPMKDSVIYKEGDAKAAQDKRRPDDVASTAASSKKRKTGAGSGDVAAVEGKLQIQVTVKAMAETQGQVLLQAHDETSAMDGVIDGTDDCQASSAKVPAPKAAKFATPQSRDLQWFDDMQLSCVQILASHGLCLQDGSHPQQETAPEDEIITQIRQQLFAVAVSTGLSFVWGKEVVIGSKVYRAWSQARKALLTMIDDAARKSRQSPEQAAEMLSGATASSNPGQEALKSGTGNGNGAGGAAGAPVAWADELLKACGESLDRAPKSESAAKQQEALAAKLVQTHAAQLEAHIASAARMSTPIQMQPCFTSAQQQVWSTCEAAARQGRFNVESMVDAMMYAVESTHSHTLLSLVALLQEHKPANMPPALKETAAATFVQVSQSRASFILQLFKAVVGLMADVEDESPFAEKKYETLKGKLDVIERTLRDKAASNLLRTFDAGSLLKSELPLEDHVEIWQRVFLELADDASCTRAVAFGSKAIEDKLSASNGKGPAASAGGGGGASVDDRADQEDGTGKDEDSQGQPNKTDKVSTKATLYQILTACHPEEAPEWEAPSGLDDETIPVNDISEAEFNMSTLQPVLAQIEATLYSMAFMSEVMENYSYMDIDVTQKVPSVMCTESPKKLSWIPFAGKVSVNKSPTDSYTLCAS